MRSLRATPAPCPLFNQPIRPCAFHRARNLSQDGPWQRNAARHLHPIGRQFRPYLGVTDHDSSVANDRATGPSPVRADTQHPNAWRQGNARLAIGAVVW